MEVLYFINNGKVRENNEDGLLIGELLLLESMKEIKKIEGDFNQIVVSDGMGGLEHGEIATKIVLENFKKSSLSTQEEIETIIHKSASELLDNSGCAIAGIRFEDGVVFNVGDCRVYKKVDIFLNKLSKDHSLAQRLIDSGEIDEEDINDFNRKNMLTSAIIKNKEIEIYQKEMKIKSGDIFLVCSDGLWGEFSLEELEECFESENIDEIGRSIFQKLQPKSLQDNISFAVIKV